MIDIKVLKTLARQAGKEIMVVYQEVAAAKEKLDGSPVTEADERADQIITKGLKAAFPDIPIVSEEVASSHHLVPGDRWFLVDPLDGTKEFLKRDGKGAFTVNIALIEKGVPVCGVVYAPALDKLYVGAPEGAYLESEKHNESIQVRPSPVEMVAVASASHRDAETDAWLQEEGITKTESVGSSLKFCLLAEGKADVYPRFGPTMEWDTAAGHAVLVAAGGCVTEPHGESFLYGKPEYRNGAFVAWSTQLPGLGA